MFAKEMNLMHLVSEHFLYKQHFDLPMSHFQTLIR